MPGTIESVWTVATDSERFPSFFDGFAIIPSVDRVEPLYETPKVGKKRRIHNSDGSVLEEEIVVFSPSQEHRYRLISGFTFPFSWMVHGAEGVWTFQACTEGGVNVEWRYTFHVRALLLSPLTYLVAHLFFYRAMLRCMEKMAMVTAQDHQE
jgi:hypothetical protein